MVCTAVPCARAGGVFERRRDVEGATAQLRGLLPGLAAELGVRGLEYVSIQNQVRGLQSGCNVTCNVT